MKSAKYARIRLDGAAERQPFGRHNYRLNVASYQNGIGADAWVRVSEILQRAPGALGTRLHRKIGDPMTLLAIASWDSKASRDAMERRRDDVVNAILREAAEHCEVRVIGEFEEPEWVVEGSEEPPGRG